MRYNRAVSPTPMPRDLIQTSHNSTGRRYTHTGLEHGHRMPSIDGKIRQTEAKPQGTLPRMPYFADETFPTPGLDQKLRARDYIEAVLPRSPLR